MVERIAGNENDTQVADCCRWGDKAAVHFQEKISNLLQQHLGGHNHELCFIGVWFVLI